MYIIVLVSYLPILFHIPCQRLCIIFTHHIQCLSPLNTLVPKRFHYHPSPHHSSSPRRDTSPQPSSDSCDTQSTSTCSHLHTSRYLPSVLSEFFLPLSSPLPPRFVPCISPLVAIPIHRVCLPLHNCLSTVLHYLACKVSLVVTIEAVFRCVGPWWSAHPSCFRFLAVVPFHRTLTIRLVSLSPAQPAFCR